MNPKILSDIKSQCKVFLQRTIKAIAVSAWKRNILNLFYLKLNGAQRHIFYKLFAKIFRDTDLHADGGTWQIYFADEKILIPLTSELFWLDWDISVSIVAHDLEVKETYETILSSSVSKPDLFVDIGANYGTHSLLFLMKGIDTITFEPNKLCHDYFKQMCDYNHVSPTLEKVALGENNGYVNLVYPKKDTWNGSTNTNFIPGLVDRCSVSEDLVTEQVNQSRLDDYFARFSGKKTLMKIDTEGNELSVLMGGKEILTAVQPTIVFECMPKRDLRTKIFDFFLSEDYLVYQLPWNPETSSLPMDCDRFLEDRATNFIAVSKHSSFSSKD